MEYRMINRHNDDALALAMCLHIARKYFGGSLLRPSIVRKYGYRGLVLALRHNR